MTRARQRGVALLVALLVVALAVILIAALLDRGELAYARTRNGLRLEQAEAYAQGLEAYAAQVLLVSSEQGQPDTNASAWAFPLPPQPVPGGTISATMRDRNGCFNLNNLGSGQAQWRTIFGNLLQVLGITDPALRPAIADWLGGEPDASDANYYLALPVPYRRRGGAFAHVSELRLVRGVSAEVYARLAPYVCALPPGTRLNVNTASVPLLQSLATPPLSQSAAASVWNQGHAQYATVAEFQHAAETAGVGQNAFSSSVALLTVNSSYFEAHGDIVLDDVPFAFTSLIERPQGSGAIRVLERSRGSDDALTEAAPLQGRKDAADDLQ